MVNYYKKHLNLKSNIYLEQLIKEHAFWMEPDNGRLVKLKDGEFLNRYWDNDPRPRPESYVEDVELAHNLNADDAAMLFRNIRAACESGWDFSSRWLTNSHDLASIITTDLIPVDLNCLLYFLETEIANNLNGSEKEHYLNLAANRKNAINKYCWNNQQQFYCDYNFKSNTSRANLTLAGIFPMFFNLAEKEEAEIMAKKIKSLFLKEGGLITTVDPTVQQWDAPNGWAPLQYMTVIAMENYGFKDLAKEIKNNWLKLNNNVFKATGKFTEKYNVQNPEDVTGGGEYPNQDGFGWTNGVFLALSK